METIKIDGNDLYSILVNYKNYRENNGLAKDKILDIIIEDFRPTLNSSAKDAIKYLESQNVEPTNIKLWQRLKK